MALDPQQIILEQSEIAALLVLEGISINEALDIARKMIEYERTISQERHDQSYPALNESVQKIPANMQTAEPPAFIQELLEGGKGAAKNLDPALDPKLILETFKFMQKLDAKRAALEARQSILQGASVMRYRKRAANQLIKALKGIT